jgi:hypothetical protein
MTTQQPVVTRSAEGGFTLIEVMIATCILMLVTGTIIQGTLNMTQVSEVVANRSEMHAAVRNATALLQQEVGQAGRISLPAPATMTTAVAALGAATVTISPSVAGIFVGERLVVGTGASVETVTVTAVNAGTSQITATFGQIHGAGVPIVVAGGFAAGVIPTTMTDGSTGSVLKIVGDINGNGQLVYVEYTCDTANGRLYRNSMPYDTAAASKPDVTIEEVLIDNIQANPDATPCFTYDERDVGGDTFVIGVAITLTARTQERDPVTGEFQTETKALLNVAPRNVFHAWQLASLGFDNRVQALPPTVQALLPTEEDQ